MKSAEYLHLQANVSLKKDPAYWKFLGNPKSLVPNRLFFLQYIPPRLIFAFASSRAETYPAVFPYGVVYLRYKLISPANNYLLEYFLLRTFFLFFQWWGRHGPPPPTAEPDQQALGDQFPANDQTYGAMSTGNIPNLTSQRTRIQCNNLNKPVMRNTHSVPSSWTVQQVPGSQLPADDKAHGAMSTGNFPYVTSHWARTQYTNEGK